MENNVQGSIIAVQKEGTAYEYDLWLKVNSFTGATVEATCGSFEYIELHEDEWATEVTGPLVYNLTPSLI